MRQSDTIASIQKYIHDNYPDVSVLTSRSLQNVRMDDALRKRTDKYFGVGLVHRTDIPVGGVPFLDNDRWCILYSGKDEDDVRDVISDIQNDLSEKNRILGYLYEYTFQNPRINIITDSVAVPNQEYITPENYTLAFSGVRNINSIEYESELYKHGEITIPADSYLNMQFPKVPAKVTIFDKYNVYIQQNDDYIKVAEINQIDKSCNQIGIVRSLEPIVPNENPNSSKLIPYKKMQVISTYSEMDENPLEDGFWSGFVLLYLQTPGMLKDSNDRLFGSISTRIMVN